MSMSMPVALGFQSFGVLFAALVCLIVGAVSKDTMSIQLQAATLEYFNPEYLDKSAFVRVSRKSRNKAPVFNALFPFIKDVPTETEVKYVAFQKMRNAWRPTLMKGTVLFCSMLDSNNQLYKHIYEHATFPHKCPVKKGNYTFNDVSVGDNDIPPVLPPAELKVKSTWLIPRTKLLIYDMELRVVRKGATGAQSPEAASVLAINQTLG